MHEIKSSVKNNPDLLREKEQVNLFLKDMLHLTKKELDKTKNDLSATIESHQKTTNILSNVKQENIFLNDIRNVLDSKVKVLEKITSPRIIPQKPFSKNNVTKKMIHDQQIPLISLNRTIENLNESFDDHFGSEWIDNFQKLEDGVLLAKLQIEEIVEYTQKESWT